MTRLEELLDWLKTCPVDYLRHSTIQNNIVVTFDVAEEKTNKELQWQK